MFTGLIENQGTITSFTPIPGGRRLNLVCSSPLACDIGDSISINGCCLTVVEIDHLNLSFDVSTESINCTSFQNENLIGNKVNLERAMLPSTRFGGHIVTGHVDTIGRINCVTKTGLMKIIEIAYPKDNLALMVPKGSITVSGVSLTINKLSEPGQPCTFSVTLIPQTLKETNLDLLKVDDMVNLEFDILGKYAKRHLDAYHQMFGSNGALP